MNTIRASLHRGGLSTASTDELANATIILSSILIAFGLGGRLLLAVGPPILVGVLWIFSILVLIALFLRLLLTLLKAFFSE